MRYHVSVHAAIATNLSVGCEQSAGLSLVVEVVESGFATQLRYAPRGVATDPHR